MDFVLDSGAKISITVSSFEDALNLTKSIERAIKGLKLPVSALGIEIDTKNPSSMFMQNNDLMGEVIDKIISVATSEEVELCLFKCFARATYEGVKITKDLFDDISLGDKAREDYYPMCVKVIEVNCSPFFKRALSAFAGLGAGIPKAQKLK